MSYSVYIGVTVTAGSTVTAYTTCNRTTLLIAGTLSYTLQANHDDTATCALNTTSAYIPSVGQSFYVYESVDGENKFGGVINNVVIEKLEAGTGTSKRIRVDLNVSPFKAIASRRTVNYSETAVTAKTIVQKVITTLTDEGVTEGTVNTGVSDIGEYDAPLNTCAQVMDDMALASGYQWYIDPDKKLHFFNFDTAISAPYTVTETGNYTINSYSYDIDQYANKIFIQGHPDVTAVITRQDTAEQTTRAAIEGGSGVYGATIIDENITTETDANTAGDAALNWMGIIPQKLTFTAYDNLSDWYPGLRVTASLPSIGLTANTSFSIDSVTTSDQGTYFQAQINCSIRKSTAFSSALAQTGIEYLAKLVGDKGGAGSSTTVNPEIAMAWHSNTAAKTVSSAETVITTRSIVFPRLIKTVIGFSCKMALATSSANVTLKTYVDGNALPYQPSFYCANSATYTLSYTDVKAAISTGTKTVEVKAVTDGPVGTIASGQSTMWVQLFSDSFPSLTDATSFTATTISDVEIDLAWVNPTSIYFTAAQIYRATSALTTATQSWCSANITCVYTGASTSSANTGLTASTQYYYKMFSAYLVEGITYYSPGVTASATTNAPTGTTTGYIFNGSGTSAIRTCDEYTPDTWANKTDTPTPARYYLASCTISNKCYIYGGNTGAAYLRDCDEYAPDTWANKTDMSNPLLYLSASTISDKGYVYGGRYDSTLQRFCNEYNPDTWTAKTNMPTPGRSCQGSTTISDKGYIFGGQGPLWDCDEYSPDTWTSKTDMPDPARQYCAAFTISDKGYVIAGAGVAILGDCDEYNPDTWTSKTDLPSPTRLSLGASTIGVKGYAFCGSDNPNPLSDCDEYAPDTWANKTDAPSPARQHLTSSSI